MLTGFLVALLLVLIFTALRFARQGETATHPFSVHDMLAMDRISDPQASPDGRRIVFTLRVTDLEENKGRNDLWLVNVDGTGLRRLTTHPAGSSHGRWAPDGSVVYFLSARSDSTQVWRISPDGGEAERVTNLALDDLIWHTGKDSG